MHLQRLYGQVRKAIDDYQMIQPNDCIAIGISGGKDSLTLLYALAGLRDFYPHNFSLKAITVDLGYDNFDLTAIKQLCDKLDIPYYIMKTQISEIVSMHSNEKSQCALCSRLRKGALNDYALSLGCNKVAYAHHRDDMIETMMMSLFYEGQFYCFPPVTYLEKTKLTLIRPLMYLSEYDVIGFQRKYNLPITKNPCPYDGHTKREYVKTLIHSIGKDNPEVKKRLFHAIVEGGISDWPDKTNNGRTRI